MDISSETIFEQTTESLDELFRIPIRLKHRYIGGATVAAARTRPMLIGGERAVYAESK